MSRTCYNFLIIRTGSYLRWGIRIIVKHMTCRYREKRNKEKRKKRTYGKTGITGYLIPPGDVDKSSGGTP